jgi:serine-type D-Ala-D-Ala carboxypeptidase/endopeptidase
MLLYVAANLGLKDTKLAKAIDRSHSGRFNTDRGGMQIGLGWHMVTREGVEIITHGGGTGGYRSFAGFIKSKKLGVVLLTNTAREVDDIGMHLLAPSLKVSEKFNTPRSEHKEVKVDPKIFDAYAGKYELAPGAFFEITREGDRLMAQLTGQPKFELFPESETQFFYKDVDAQITFNKEDKGQISHLELSQNGMKMKAWNTKFPRPKEKEIEIDAKILERYAGKYELAPNVVFTITVEDKKLMAQLTGQPKMQVFAESETKFGYRIVDAQLTFMKDGDGKVTHLILRQGGIEQKAARK